MNTPACHITGSSLVGRLAEEMTACWEDGSRPLAEEYLSRHPDLWDRPAAALELIAEELALREEYGEETSPVDLAARFPQWCREVQALADCQKALGARPGVSRFPSPGERLGEFRLVAELGRGGHGRVFLAAQSSLGGRPVVLKLAPEAGSEHLTLARLQHTNIVPLYSAHTFPQFGLRGLCMPYFGGATLAALLAAVAARPPAGRTGGDLVATLRRAQAVAPVAVAVAGPACTLLERPSYPEAVCHIGICLADALQDAHDHGLLHLDLKPSNVLIAADGVPMLLDFHLARPPLAAGDPPPPWLGGTPGYMAPELHAAVQAVRAGAPVSAAVDARTDVYALGVLLSEALGGDRPAGPVGLADILDRCTAAAPADRYPTAAALAADLRRHLAHLPLKGVRNRSLVERWGKWRRRRPYALPLVAAVALLVGAAAGFVLHTDRQAVRAGTALREGEAHLDRARYSEAVEVLRGGERLAGDVPFHRSLSRQLRDARLRAERGQAAADLHLYCERVRPLYAAEVVAPEQLRAAEARCRELWAGREVIASRLRGQSGPDLDRRWRADLLDLGILTARFQAGMAPPDQPGPAHRRALAILNEAERLLGPSGVLCLERAAHARAVGLSDVADVADRRREEMLPPQTPWEHLVVGRAYLGAGDLDRAAAEFDRCLDQDPGSYWANYYRGTCALRRGEPTAAVAAFTACAALAPQSGWCFYNRGLANTAADRPDQAAADFGRALALDPGLGQAYLGRAAVHHRLGRHPAAVADLRLARAAGLPAPTVDYHVAVVYLSAGDRAAAVAALRACLAQAPDHRDARQLFDRLQPDQ